jgi:hypothetical protein
MKISNKVNALIATLPASNAQPQTYLIVYLVKMDYFSMTHNAFSRVP